MTFARETLDIWGLTTWTLRWDRAKRRAGACDHARNQIRLSKPLFDVFPEDAQRNGLRVIPAKAAARAPPTGAAPSDADNEHAEVRKAVIAALGHTPEGLDQIISKVMK